MKLDRNIEPDGKGKYALLRLREWPHGYSQECQEAFDLLVDAGAIDFGSSPETEFFVIRLKDKYAGNALASYAAAAALDGETEFAEEVRELATKSFNYPKRRKPD